MKIRNLVATILFTSALLFSSCGGLGSKDYTEMPTGADFEKVFTALMKDKKGAEFYQIYGQFDAQSRNMSIPTSMTVTYIPADNKKELYEYSRNMTDGRWVGPSQVTLHEAQIGPERSEALSREDFTSVIFNVDEMPAFSQFDEMYKKALASAGLGDESCVVRFTMEKKNNVCYFSITVGMKEKGNRTEKVVYFDKAGNVIEH